VIQLVRAKRVAVLLRLRRRSFACALNDDFVALDNLCFESLRSPFVRRIVGNSRISFFEWLYTLRNSYDAFASLLGTAASARSLDFAHRFLLELAQIPSLLKPGAISPLDAVDSTGATVLHRSFRGLSAICRVSDAQRIASEIGPMVKFWLTLAPHLAIVRDNAGYTPLDLAKENEYFHLVLQLGGEHIDFGNSNVAQSMEGISRIVNSEPFSLSSQDQEGLKRFDSLYHAATRNRLQVAYDRAIKQNQQEPARLDAIENSRSVELPWNPDRPGFRAEKARRQKEIRITLEARMRTRFPAPGSESGSSPTAPTGYKRLTRFLGLGVVGGSEAEQFWLDPTSGKYVENADFLGSVPIDGAGDELASGLLLPRSWLAQRVAIEAQTQKLKEAQAAELNWTARLARARAKAKAQASRGNLTVPTPVIDSTAITLTTNSTATLVDASLDVPNANGDSSPQLEREERRRQRHQAVLRKRAERDLNEPAGLPDRVNTKNISGALDFQKSKLQEETQIARIRADAQHPVLSFISSYMST